MTKKKSTTALSTISKNDIAKEGIEVKLTQNDIIELMVEEKLNEVKAQAHALAEEGRNVLTLANSYRQDIWNAVKRHEEEILNHLRKSFSDTSILEVIGIDYEINSSYSNKQIFFIIEKDIPTIGERDNRLVKHDFIKTFKNNRVKVIAYIKVRTPIGCITIGSDLPEIKIGSTLTDEIINDHNTRIKEFQAICNTLDISKIKKEMRLAFNKELLKAMSDEFKDKLYTSFGMSL